MYITSVHHTTGAPEQLLSKLMDYSAIRLSAISRIKVSNRQDTKFIFSSAKLPHLIDALSDKYFVLEIDSAHLFDYSNQYFDTDGFRLYLQHHNGLRPRHKIRFRQYVDTGTSYFEIKTKNNKGRTEKQRLLVAPDVTSFLAPDIIRDDQAVSTIHAMIEQHTGLDHDELIQAVEIHFNRITLVVIMPVPSASLLIMILSLNPMVT